MPIARAAGIPLFAKRMPASDHQHQKPVCYKIVRFMSDPAVGVAALDWQVGPLPPVLVGRTDGVPFSVEDFFLLDDFEMAMLDHGPRRVTPEDLSSFIDARLLRKPGLGTSPLVLSNKFPRGMHVYPTDLTSDRCLNFVCGHVAGRYEQGRVGVIFPPPHGLKAVNPGNLVRA